MKALLTNQFRKTGTVAGGFMGLFGFIADILSPIAPFTSYLFFISVFLIVLILIIMVVKSTLQEKLASTLVFLITLSVVSGSLYAFEEEPEIGSTNYGVLATQIPALQSLQSSLGLIQEDVAAIKESVENIDKTTARTEQVVKQVEINTKETTEATKKIADAVEESTKQIVGSLEEIQKGFTLLTQAGGVIANPIRPEQFYHNARIQELGGDYGNARQSYNKYFTFKLDFIDPHLRYQSFLKIQEGRAGAREIYSYLYENDPRPIVEYARILLFDAPQRTQMLEDFIKSNPDFAPAYYELSLEYSQARKGTQSLSDKKAEYKALEQFNALTKEGKLFKYFVDKETVSKWVDYAEQSLKNMPLINTLDGSPVKLIPSFSNQGWTHKIEISETVREIFYRVDEDINFESTGFFDDDINRVTGEPRAISRIKMPFTVSSASIYIKYIDINRVEKGPYEVQFDAYPMMIKRAKGSHNDPANWVSFPRPERYNYISNNVYPYRHLNLGNLIRKRCGISKINYGVNTTEIDQFETITLGKCDYTQINRNLKTDPDWFVSLIDLNFIAIQLEFRDGTYSKVRSFQNPFAPLVKIEKHANGQKKSEGGYLFEVKEGKWTFWRDDGTKSSDGSYKKGLKEGKWTSWHSDGTKSSEGDYRNALKVGIWKKWDWKGRLVSISQPKLKREKIMTYHKNNQTKTEKNFKNGKKDGKWTVWYDDGRIKSEEMHSVR